MINILSFLALLLSFSLFGQNDNVFLKKNEFAEIIKRCSYQQVCMRKEFLKKSRIPAIDVVLNEVFSNKNSMFNKIKNFKVFSTKLPGGPDAKIFVSDKYDKIFKSKNFNKKTVKVVMLTGTVFLYYPENADSSWKSKVYNPLLEQLSSLDVVAKKVLGK